MNASVLVIIDRKQLIADVRSFVELHEGCTISEIAKGLGFAATSEVEFIIRQVVDILDDVGIVDFVSRKCYSTSRSAR